MSLSITPNPINSDVQKDNATSDSGQLTTTDSFGGSTFTWTIQGGTTPHAPNYSFAIDEFQLSENGSQTFDDTFTSLTPPNYQGSPIAYAVQGGTITNNGHQDLLTGANSASVGSGSNGQIVYLRTDTTTDPNLGLKSGKSFSVSGVFD